MPSSQLFWEKKKIFSTEGKLNEFIASTPALKEMLKKVLHKVENDTTGKLGTSRK